MAEAQRMLLRLPQGRTVCPLSLELPRCPPPPVLVIDGFLDELMCGELLSQLGPRVDKVEDGTPQQCAVSEVALPTAFDLFVPAALAESIQAAMRNGCHKPAAVNCDAHGIFNTARPARIMPGQFTSQSLPWHQDVSADGSVVQANVAILYLAGSGQLWLAEQEASAEAETICLDVVPGRLVSWCNRRYKHKAEAAAGAVRVAIGPIWEDARGVVCQSKGPFHRPNCPHRGRKHPRSCDCWRRPAHLASRKGMGKFRPAPPSPKTSAAKRKGFGKGRPTPLQMAKAPLASRKGLGKRQPMPRVAKVSLAKSNGTGKGQGTVAMRAACQPPARAGKAAVTPGAPPAKNPPLGTTPSTLTVFGWTCQACTFINKKQLALACEVCGVFRHSSASPPKPIAAQKQTPALRIGAAPMPMPFAKEIIFEAGAMLGRSQEEIRPFVQHIVEKEWYTTAEHLKHITATQWDQMRTEMRMPMCLMNMIQNRLAAVLAAPVKDCTASSAAQP